MSHYVKSFRHVMCCRCCDFIQVDEFGCCVASACSRLMTEPILVELIGGSRFCVFSARDAATLRIAHRICGECLGVSHSTLATSSVQTESKATSGLPLCLSAIEVLFAYTQGWIKIVKRTLKVAACRSQFDANPSLLTPADAPSATRLHQWATELSLDFDKQLHEQEDRRAAALLRAGKSGSSALPAPSLQDSNSELNSSEPALKRPKLAATTPIVTDKSILNLPLGSYVRLAAEQHPNNAALHRQLQFTPSGVLAEIEQDSTLIAEEPLSQWICLLWSDEIQSSASVPLEHSKVELALHRAAVYADLWHRGYYITAARKFGSDFLVYPRPQHECHAACLVLVRPRDSPDSASDVPKMTALDLASLTRLASSVKKSLVLASVSPPAGSSFVDRLIAGSGQDLKQCLADIKPSYLTIDWMQRETTIPSATK